MRSWSVEEGQLALTGPDYYGVFSLQYPDRSFYSWYGYRRSHGVPTPWGNGPTTKQSNHPALTIHQTNHQIDPQVLLDHLIALQKRLVNKPGIPRAQIQTTHPIAVAFLSDLHIGNEGTDHEALLADVRRIAATPGLYVVLGGDVVDNFAANPKLQHVASEDLLRPGYQWQIFGWLLRELEGSLLAVGEGNHDAWTRIASDLNPLLSFLEEVPVINTGEGGLFELQVGNQLYNIARKHKPRGGSTENPTHAVKRWYKNGPYQFDVGVIEHHHTPTVEPFWAHGLERLAIRTGTYKVLDSFASEHGFYGAELAVPTVLFDPHERKMVPFKHLDDAILHLSLFYDSVN